MESRTRSNLVWGALLILLGAWFLLVQLFPGLGLLFGPNAWPLYIVGVGVVLLVIGALTGVPSMAIPAAIVGGIGGLLYWQNATDQWESWAYAWTLIPGFVGIGTILMGLLEGKWSTMSGGIWLVVLSLIFFAIFSSFFGGPSILGQYWPILLVLLGVLLLLQSFFRRPSQVAVSKDKPSGQSK